MELFRFDDDYVQRLRDGDRETAEHFHSYFRDLLLAKLRRRLSSMHAIDEVRQEVFTRTFERLDQLRDGRKLGAFVNSICNLVLMEYYRADARAVSLEEQPDLIDPGDLETSFDAARNRARVRRTLEALDPRDADILRAVFLDEADKEEVCRRYDVDREYLRVLLHRAKEKFRTAFARRKSGRLTIFETFGAPKSLWM
ncbi:MAG: RNA polymerase sigma factor [Thermoanaerobaculia bacterium]